MQFPGPAIGQFLLGGLGITVAKASLRAAAFGGVHRRFGLVERGMQARAARQALIKLVSKVGRYRVVNRPRRGNHRRNVRIQQVLGLLRGGTAVKKDQLQTLLLSKKPGQPGGVGGSYRA